MIVNSINLFRKYVFLKLTKNIGTKPTELPNNKLEVDFVKSILVVRPNHRLGNLLLASALVKELESIFPDASIDFLAKGGLAKIIYKNYSSIKTIYQLPKRPFRHPIKYLKIYFKIKNTQYDLVMNATANSSSGRIFSNISQAKIKVIGEEFGNGLQNPDDCCHIAKQQIYQLRSCLT